MNLHTYHFIHLHVQTRGHRCFTYTHSLQLTGTHTPLHMYNSNHRSTTMLHIIFPDLHPQCVKPFENVGVLT
uniref:Uncharacterized protein n=1 Tax=Arundo donax TaxID=35708 RepID=A0A0A9G154_ARUDO